MGAPEAALPLWALGVQEVMTVLKKMVFNSQSFAIEGPALLESVSSLSSEGYKKWLDHLKMLQGN